MKKINLDLIGIDGNAFALMSAFRKQARKEGWKENEIETVLIECKSGDYMHLLDTLQNYCK